MQSHILAPAFSSSLEVIPFNPVPNSDVLHGILKSSFLTMTLKHHHIYAIYGIHYFHSLNFDLANGIWHILKDLSRSIHEVADPTVNLFEALPSQLNPAHLRKIEMASLHILQIENFSQNMLLCTTTHEEIRRLFSTAQTIGMETLEWIVEAKRQCRMIGRRHGWHWAINKGVDSNLFPALEGQSLLSETTLEPSNSTALILHPCFSTRSSNNIITPPPTYVDEDIAEMRHRIL